MKAFTYIKQGVFGFTEKEKPARIGRATVMPAVIPANRACTTYSPGARNIKENSIGSVTPVKKEQKAAEAKSP